MTRLGGLVALAATLVVAAPAGAYVRARTGDGIPVHWLGSCVYFQPDADGSPDLPADAVFATIQRSLDDWAMALGSQSYLKLQYAAPAGPMKARLDGINVVHFRTNEWSCAAGTKPDPAHDVVCYSPDAAAITTVFYVQDGDKKAGAIEDTDIELNELNFFFANVDESLPLPNVPSGRMLADLENTLTHELGHAMGLDHTCAIRGNADPTQNTPVQEVDENGQPPPECRELGLLPAAERDKIKTATMFNYYDPGEVTKRHPHPDDIAGIVASYPPDKDPKSCKPTNLDDFAHGCAFVGGPARSLCGLSLLLLALVALVARRRRG